jgi:tetratricopeptide (TPR) repeat protein
LYAQNKLDEAIATDRTAIAIDAKSANAYASLGSVLKQKGLLGEAIACFRKAIELDQEFALAHCNLGIALASQGKLDEAIAAYRTAIEIDPKSARTRNALGNALAKKGWDLAYGPDPKLRDPKRALEASKEAVELAPQSALAWQYSGWAQYRAGNWNASLEALEKSCRLQIPGDRGRWIVMSLAHGKLATEKNLPEGERERHRTEARRWYDQAVKQVGKPVSGEKPFDQAVQAFLAEAAELLGVKVKQE